MFVDRREAHSRKSSNTYRYLGNSGLLKVPINDSGVVLTAKG